MPTEVIPIRLEMVNAFILRGPSGYILVDAGIPGMSGRILEAMRTHGLAPEGLRLILITHGHLDHFGSAAEVRDKTGAPIAVHQGDAVALRQGTSPAEWLRATSWLMAVVRRLAAHAGPQKVAGLEPDVILTGETRLDPYGIPGRVIPVPGHTPGSVAVLLDGGEAIVGDIVMRMFGRSARPGRPFVAWDLAMNEESVRRLAALNPHPVYAGHGGPFESL